MTLAKIGLGQKLGLSRIELKVKSHLINDQILKD